MQTERASARGDEQEQRRSLIQLSRVLTMVYGWVTDTFFFVPDPSSSNQTTFCNITRDFVIPSCSTELAISNGIGKMETV